MTPDQRGALIEQARRLLQQAMNDCDLPQIETILRSADQELHWALWNLGQSVPLRPEFDSPTS